MIEIKNLTKRFQDFTALENVTCTIGSGCIYGMVCLLYTSDAADE